MFGRVRSTLGWGEHIVIVKPDGSMLVHQRVGREPVNWQLPDTRARYQTETDNGTPTLRGFARYCAHQHTNHDNNPERE